MKRFWLILAMVAVVMALPVVAVAQGMDHMVESGDTLSSIAARYLGSPADYLEIVEATNAMSAEDITYAFIENPDMIRAGWKILIPAGAVAATAEEAEEAVEQPGAEAPLGQGRIAFSVIEPSSYLDLYRLYFVNPDGSGLTKFRDHASEPAFSPKGDRIAYKSWAENDRGLVVETFDGSARYPVGGAFEDAHAAWSEDGNLIVFDSQRESDRLWRVHTVTIDGLNESVVKVQSRELLGERPALSPDAARVVFRDTGGAEPGLAIVHLGGGGRVPLTDGGTDTAPAWSPDGSMIAFMSAVGGSWDVYVIGADGAGLASLTSSPSNDGLPEWSPDGKKLAFLTDRNGVWSIYTMNADGSDQRKVVDVGGRYDNNRYGEDRDWADEQISWGP